MVLGALEGLGAVKTVEPLGAAWRELRGGGLTKLDLRRKGDAGLAVACAKGYLGRSASCLTSIDIRCACRSRSWEHVYMRNAAAMISRVLGRTRLGRPCNAPTMCMQTMIWIHEAACLSAPHAEGLTSRPAYAAHAQPAQPTCQWPPCWLITKILMIIMIK